jgi:hypothetical protein
LHQVAESGFNGSMSSRCIMNCFFRHETFMEFGRNNFRQLYVITHTLPFLHCLYSEGKQFPPLSCTLSPFTHRKQCIKSKRFFHSSVEATGIDKNNTIRVSEGRSWWFSDNSIKIARCLLHFPPFRFFCVFPSYYDINLLILAGLDHV